MHVGLFDLEWRGHHTPYDSLVSRYLVETDNEVTFITSADHPRTDEFPHTSDFHLVQLNSGVVETQDGQLSKVLLDQTVKVRQCILTLRVADRADVDVLHVPTIDYLEIPLAAAIRATRTSVPIIATLHQDHFISDASNVGLPKRVFDVANRWSLNSLFGDGRLKKLIVHSERMRSRIIDSVREVTDDTVVRMAAPTPDVEREISSDEARRQLDLPESGPLLLFFGGLRYDKGPDVLAEAMTKLETTQHVSLVFAGPERQFTEADVRRWKRNVGENVNIVNRIDYIPEKKVDSYFIAADALVLPYRRTVGISGPLRRACMANTHIIGNEESDIGDVINRNNLGQTFETGSAESLANAITEFVENAERYPSGDTLSYGQSCYWRKTGEELISIYEEAAQ